MIQWQKYLVETQDKRNVRIVKYLKEVFKKHGEWNENSGIEISNTQTVEMVTPKKL